MERHPPFCSPMRSSGSCSTSDRGADIQAADLRERTAFYAAIEKGGDNHLVVPWLIEKGIDVLVMDINGRTVIDCTRRSEQQNIATPLKQIAGN